MQTYLGEDPDTLDAIEFLCLAEGGEVTHYEVLETILVVYLSDSGIHINYHALSARQRVFSLTLEI